MTLTLVIVSSLSAAVGSLCTGYLLKLIEHRREARDATQLEVARRRAVARFEAIRTIHGMARELYHAINGVVRYEGEDLSYSQRVEELCRDLRQSARSEVEVLGEPYVESVHALTDAAMEVLRSSHRYSSFGRREYPYPVPPFFEDRWMAFLDLSIDLPRQKQQKEPEMPQKPLPSLDVKAQPPERRRKGDVLPALPLALEDKIRKPEP
jgi:hypothetical protein